jgi:predicted Rossmann fold flavoprotein
MAAIHSFDALIIGGGAAGLMCAIEAGKRGRRVAVIEHTEHLGKKILISGGGRCNFTNLYCTPENFLSSNSHFAKSALARFTPGDFIALVERHRIRYHEKTLGQLFCDRSARDILNMLKEECRSAGVLIFLNAKVIDVGRATEFYVRTDEAEFHSAALVIATGGLSIAKIGATSFGYDLARGFGIKVKEPWPGLVPLVLDDDDRSRYCDLAGNSAQVIASTAGQRFREKMLITHRGLSGPAILQLSLYWKKASPIILDLAPDREIAAGFDDPKVPRNLMSLRAEVRSVLPNRFADRWTELHAPATWTNSALSAFEKQMHGWTLTPAGTEGYDKAEVTAGGVDTNELSARTMESRKVPGLYFIGEVVDVTGQLGGFNFQWAWASGAAAGRAL